MIRENRITNYRDAILNKLSRKTSDLLSCGDIRKDSLSPNNRCDTSHDNGYND